MWVARRTSLAGIVAFKSCFAMSSEWVIYKHTANELTWLIDIPGFDRFLATPGILATREFSPRLLACTHIAL